MRTHIPATLLLAAAAAAAPAQPCNPWEVVPSPDAPGEERTYVRAIKALAPDDVWVVGESYGDGQIKVFSMHYDGSAWAVVPVPDPNGAFGDSGLWAVDASGPENIWAAGHREYTPTGIPFAFFGTHNAVWRWDGSSWELMDTPQLGGGSGDFIWGMAAIAPDDVWFVGDGHPTASGPQPALAMHWDGSGFQLTEVALVNPESGRDAGNPLNDISVIAPNDIWAVGGTDVNADGAGDYSQIHHWNGSGWTHVPGPTPGYFNQLWCVAAAGPSDVWAAGEYWDVSGIHPLLIHWDGSSWTEVLAPGGFLDMVALAPDDIWAVGNDVFHYDGESWSLVQGFPGVPYPALAGISALGECELWAAGRQIEGDTGFRSLVVRTTGGGAACPADRDGDGLVNSGDISAFLAAWLASVQGGTPEGDFSGDGLVNSGDISAFLAAWLDAVQWGC